MERNTMIDALTSQLRAIGISCQVGVGSDVDIQTEFVDASWGTGSKRIQYHASAFLNEPERTLYFWEFTKETGSGLSFNVNAESSFQSGTTLFRKVKSVGYGPDGKAYEYSLDLGAITKTFKETAKQYGWKFKVVLKHEKAMYPPGYGTQPPLQPGYGAPANLQPPYGNPQGAFYAKGSPAQNPQGYSTQGQAVVKKGNTSPIYFFLPFGILLAITLVFFGFGDVSAVGWVLGLALLAAPLLLRGNLARAGFFGMAAIWIVIAVLLFILFGIFSASM